MIKPCPGCGYYYVVHRVHRDDCTAVDDETLTHIEALTNVINILGISGVIDDQAL